MKQSPSKLFQTVVRHKMNSQSKIERLKNKFDNRQLSKVKNSLCNVFKFKKQIKPICSNFQQLKIQGTITTLQLKNNLLQQYRESPIKNIKSNLLILSKINNQDLQQAQKTQQTQQTQQTQASTIVVKKQNSKKRQRLIQLDILKESKKVIQHYQTKQQDMSSKRIKTLPRLQSNDIFGKSKLKNNKKMTQPILLSAIQKYSLKNIKAEHYLVMESETGQSIIGHRSRTKIQVASLTKIMTFYTIYSIAKDKDIVIPDKKIKITEDVVDIPGTTADLLEDQIYTIQQLLYGLMLPSGNDAAIALAKWGGKMITQNPEDKQYVQSFINRMNLQCGKLELIDTTFGNPHGLPHRNNRTTCQDMGRLCAICLQIPLFREIVSTKVYQYKVYNDRTKNKSQFHWQNTNKLLRRPGFIGIKTGITVTAGPCLASAYIFKQKTYIVIIAKSKKISKRFKDTRRLLAHCLSKLYEGQLTKQQKYQLKKLSRSNQDIDSDYSQQQEQFDFSSYNHKQLKRRARIITEH